MPFNSEGETTATPKPVEETTPPEPKGPVDWWDCWPEEVEDPQGTFPVFNVWKPEGRCEGGDGDSFLSFTLPCNFSDRMVKEEKVKPGQFLLVTWCISTTKLTCCSGYRRASLEVLDEEPDLDDKKKYPEKKWGDAFEYEVKSHETLQSEIL